MCDTHTNNTFGVLTFAVCGNPCPDCNIPFEEHLHSEESTLPSCARTRVVKSARTGEDTRKYPFLRIEVWFSSLRELACMQFEASAGIGEQWAVVRMVH